MMFFTVVTLLFAKHVQSSIVALVVGGEMTTTTVYPYQVFLNIHGDGDWICGGSFINQVFVLTAAHCLEGFEKSPHHRVQIKFGSENMNNGRMRLMKDYRSHPRYDFQTMLADICIIKCRKAVHFGDNVQRVAIMRKPPVESYAYVAGWGVIDENLTNSEILKHVMQKIYPHEACKSLHLPEGSFCAGNAGAEDDVIVAGYPSLGDSGGPLVISNFIQIGIVSYRIKGQTIVAYTNVSYYMPWIRRNVHDLYCSN